MPPNFLLIYDDDCPLCSWYSNLFVQTGLLPTGGRLPFSRIDADLSHRIDLDRGRNEIPLLDRESGRLHYGIDALLELLGTRWPLIRKIGHWGPVHFLLLKLYKLISYNRKVIVGTRCGKDGFDCAPDLNIRYRLLFLLLFLALNTWMLMPVYRSVLPQSAGGLGMAQLQAAHFALVLINCSLALSLGLRKGLEYLGQVNMLAFTALGLLAPLAIINRFVGLGPLPIYAWLTGVTLLVLREYLRRMDYAGMLRDHRWIMAVNLLCLNAFGCFVIGYTV